MKTKRIVILGLLLLNIISNAQSDFRPGYIITINGDTIYGDIDYRGDLLMGRNCKFKANSLDNEVDYAPGDIQAYKFLNDKYYITKDIKGEKIFVEYIFKGQINFYYSRSSAGNHYYLEKNGSGMIEIPYKNGITYIDHVAYAYESKQHIGLLTYFMSDANDFQERIAKMGIPDHRSLLKLAEDYHKNIGYEGEFMAYKKKLPPVRVDLELSAGVTLHRDFDEPHSRPYFHKGILAHIWLPRFNEKLYLRTGLLHSRLIVDNIEESISKIPILIEYIYPHGNIKPKGAFGINLYSPIGQTFALMAGINIKIGEGIYWSMNYDIDFIPNDKIPMLPESICTQSFLAGIQFDL